MKLTVFYGAIVACVLACSPAQAGMRALDQAGQGLKNDVSATKNKVKPAPRTTLQVPQSLYSQMQNSAAQMQPSQFAYPQNMRSANTKPSCIKPEPGKKYKKRCLLPVVIPDEYQPELKNVMCDLWETGTFRENVEGFHCIQPGITGMITSTNQSAAADNLLDYTDTGTDEAACMLWERLPEAKCVPAQGLSPSTANQATPAQADDSDKLTLEDILNQQ